MSCSVIPPVYNCGNGHIICGICQTRVTKCGLCASNFTTVRNYTVESILALIDTKCRNTLCSQIMRADKLREHMDICEYRYVHYLDTLILSLFSVSGLINFRKLRNGFRYVQ